jgi:hypothetical protein
MSIEIVTKGGRKIGRISDEAGKDTIVVGGKEILLSDAYESEEAIKSFNDSLKDITNDRKPNKKSV